MNKFVKLFQGLTKSRHSLGSGKIQKLYEDGQNEKLIEVLQSLNSKNFVENRFEGGLNILHRACFDQNYELVKMMCSELEYFPEIVDDDSNDEGWTALLWAAQRSNIDIA